MDEDKRIKLEDQPPPALRFERSQVKCENCGRIFKHLILEKIDGLVQLRLEDGLIVHLKMPCLHCGEIFNWNITEKVITRMAVRYTELLVESKRYQPE